MAPAPSNELWLLVVYSVIGFAAALVVLGARGDRLERGRVLRAAAEIGVVGGVVWWLILRWWGLGNPGSVWAVPMSLLARVVPWGVVVGLFAAWRVERAGVAAYETSEVATRFCGGAVLLFLMIGAADLVITNW